ncbi:MAG TPA: META domain-containing protein [Candidatus Colwellbacteria bacterium]|nr:META domain-containing protein [Candidatus Colwellbacteria bacterium]HQA95864.1 META domain-containing protein [Candidatus Colwellbacteria bacterium]
MNRKKIVLCVTLLVLAVIAVFLAIRARQLAFASYSDGSTTVKAVFDNKKDTVTFTHESTGKVMLPIAISASGARYANADESIVFWEHQGEATIFKDDATVFQGRIQNTAAKKALSASTWVWEQTIMNDDSVIVPQRTNAFTLKFSTDGRVSGTTDCNSFSGSYEAWSDGAISFSPFASTLMFCEGSQESQFVSAVSDSDRYLMDDAGNLVLLIKFDSGQVHFRRQ